MHRNPRHALAATLLLATVCWVAPAQGGKPEWAGGPHAKGHGDGDRQSVQVKEPGRGGRKNASAQAVTIGGYFAEPQRAAARNYYEGRRGGKACPPGLAKKNNGCLPPGQARKWAVGQPLAREVVFHPVPQELVVTLGVPPAGYRYVRVATDILLIAVGTRMVVDGIQDLIR